MASDRTSFPTVIPGLRGPDDEPVHQRSAPGSPGRRSRVQRRYANVPAPVQRKSAGHGTGTTDVQAAAAEGVRGAGTPLPHLDLIQRAFGDYDVSNINAHVGGAAASASEAIGAKAYATGNHVAFRSTPDLHTAAHEAAHVVQQRDGVQLKGGLDQAGDPYERHADAVADAVVRGESAVPLLAAGVSGQPGAAGAGAVQRKIDDKLDDKEAVTIVDLAFQDAAERGYKAVKILQAFEGSEDTKQAMFADLVNGVERAIAHALDVFVEDDKLKKKVYFCLTLAASNMIVLAAMGPSEHDHKYFDADLGYMESTLKGWKRPSKTSGVKKADLSSAEGVKVVRLNLEAARASMLSSLDLHEQKDEDRDDIWGTGAAMFFEHTISVLGSNDMRKKRKSLKGDVKRTRDIALRLMDWAPKGEWSLRLRANVNTLAGIVGISKLATGGGGAKSNNKDKADATPKKPGDMSPGEGKATIGELEKFRTARQKAADNFETMIEQRWAAVGEIDKEIDSKDPKPKSFWESLVKGVAVAALSAVTGGVGGALASSVFAKLADSALKDGLVEGMTNFVGGGLDAIFDAAVQSGDAGSATTGAKKGGDGDWSSKDSRAAFFGLQLRALSTQKASAKSQFWDSTEPLAVEAHVEPGAAIHAMQTTAKALQQQVANAARLQRKHTAVQWTIYNVQTQMGGTIKEMNMDVEKDRMYETGYRGTDMRKAAAGDEATNKGIPSKVDLQYEDVNGMIDVWVENKQGDGTMKVKKARMAGMNSKIRERISSMVLKDVNIPIRIHGDMYGKGGGHEYMIITRNEAGSILIQSSKKGKEFLAMHGDDYHDGAGKIFDWLIDKSLNDRGIKLGS